MFKKILKVLLVLFLIYSLFGFFLLPLVIKSQLVNLVQKSSSAYLSVRQILFNPFTCKLIIDDVELKASGKVLFSFDSLLINIDPSEIVFGKIDIPEIIIKKPILNLSYTKDKTINIIEIFMKNKQTHEKINIKIPRVLLGKLSILNGKIAFKDYTHKDTFTLNFNDIDFSILNIDTKNLNKSHASLRLKTLLQSGGFINIESSIVSLDPFISHGLIHLKFTKLSKVWEYIKESVNYELRNGALEYSSAYMFNLSDLNSTSLKNITIRMKDLLLTPKKSDKAFFQLQTLNLNNVYYQPLLSNLKIDEILMDGMKVNLNRNRDNTLDILKYLKGKSDTNSGSKALNFRIKELNITHSNFIFHDETLINSKDIILKDIGITVNNITDNQKLWSTYNLAATLAQRSKIKATGEFKLHSLSQKGTFSIKEIVLRDYTSYLERESYMKIKRGELSLYGNTLFKDNAFSLETALVLNDLRVDDTKQNVKLLTIKRLNVDSLKFKSRVNRLTIDKITIDKFIINAILNKKKLLNLSTLIKENKLKKNKKDSKKERLFFALKTLNISNSRLNFNDYSLPKTFKISFHNINANIKNITNKINTIISVKLSNDIDKYASAKVVADINSDDPKKDSRVNIKLENYNMHSLTSYSYNYIGQKIESGKLFLNLIYKMKDTKLFGMNNIILQKIVLGDKKSDKNVRILSLDTALILLEDSEGKVDINVGIDGDLSKPNFKYRSLFLSVIKDIGTKVIYSPFSFIGKSLGIDSKELQYVSFEFGKSKISLEEKKQLKVVADILKKKENIFLQIAGVYDPVYDLKALNLMGTKIELNTLDILAEKRVNSIKNFLVTTCGVLSKQIIVIKSRKVESKEDKYIKEYLQILIK